MKGELQLIGVNRKNVEKIAKPTVGRQWEVDESSAEEEEGSSVDHWQLSPEEMDEALERAFLQGVKATLDPENDVHVFPMESSAFYTAVVLRSAPDGFQLDVKRSTHKKLSTFLKALAKKDLCKLKDVKGERYVLKLSIPNERRQSCGQFSHLFLLFL